jgi:hypothetical protein
MCDQILMLEEKKSYIMTHIGQIPIQWCKQSKDPMFTYHNYDLHKLLFQQKVLN